MIGVSIRDDRSEGEACLTFHGPCGLATPELGTCGRRVSGLLFAFCLLLVGLVVIPMSRTFRQPSEPS